MKWLRVPDPLTLLVACVVLAAGLTQRMHLSHMELVVNALHVVERRETTDVVDERVRCVHVEEMMCASPAMEGRRTSIADVGTFDTETLKGGFKFRHHDVVSARRQNDLAAISLLLVENLVAFSGLLQ